MTDRKLVEEDRPATSSCELSGNKQMNGLDTSRWEVAVNKLKRAGAANSSRWSAGHLHRFTYPTPENPAGQHHVATDREPAEKNNRSHIQSWWTGGTLSEGS